eukprot:CAMPEP_0194776742 /NCGR_PEP_ID=MMETSP0323_2-20130528/63872_1 /TAXON_ID=2866 ORGANISM="Crypthecodinium cohnii, Strain Seligo" /NCGR_SAMPLE_ID=MMETSP0323_2 /ASSEMBLY_ACC=CAM_ASM_000346 /LENGTH=157 /DNA_ID=CAMNT_0039713263 /DNA_START=22 /DNA_END=495 /DNA_ORIENTATION=-
MAGVTDKKLAELGITLPPCVVPMASYVPFVRTGNVVFMSGQIPKTENGMLIGKLGHDYSIEQGQEAARQCAINMISAMKEACGGDLDKVKQVLKVEGFVNSTPEFTDHPKVINGFSDLMAQVFEERGKHARFALGVSNLPLGVAVEVGAAFEIMPDA